MLAAGPLRAKARATRKGANAAQVTANWMHLIASLGRHSATVARVRIQRMEHVGIVGDDLAAATAFF